MTNATIVFLVFLGATSITLRAQSGAVRSSGQPIPGATVTAKPINSQQGTQTFSTTTDENGRYSFSSLSPGTWTIEVQMFGFESAKRDVDFSASAKSADFNLQLQPSPFAERLARFRGSGAQGQADTQLQAQLNEPQPQAIPAPTAQSSNESFLVSGSLSSGLSPTAMPDSGPGIDVRPQDRFGASGEGGAFPGASSSSGGGAAPGFGGGGGMGGGPGGMGGGPGMGGRGPGMGGPRGGNRGQFTARQFGNRRAQNAIRGMAFFNLSNSALNAKPFSVTGQDVEQPAYAQSRFGFLVGGPLVIPKLMKDPSTFFFLSYFGTRARNPFTAVATVPTELERQGNFSQSIQSGGPVSIYDPVTGQPFANNIIPANRISPIAQSLLSYIPHPNQPGLVNNYQLITSVPQNTDNFGLRLQRNLTTKDRLALSLNFQRRDSETSQTYGFLDEGNGSGANVNLQWTRTLTANIINNARIQFNRNRNETTPFFANGPNVAAQLGIQGTSTDPINYGPPNISFTNFGSLNDASPILTRNQSQSISESISISRGLHNFTFGFDYRRNDLNTRTDQNGRGTLSFNGLLTSAFDANGQPLSGTGFDMADFLLGLPQSTSIRYGSSSTYFLQDAYDGYAQDDWRIHPNFSLTLGIRYEYTTPLREKYGHMANLDIAPGFTGVAVVLPGQTGPYTGNFSDALINPDRNNFSPRIGLAWKIPGKKTLLVRAGYGIYYNEQAYNSFITRLSAQPPFAVSNTLNTSLTDLLTIAEGFATIPSNKEITNTYAVDRYYRTPYAQTWNFSIQRELPKGFFVEAGYIGTKGTRLDIQRSPNRAAPGDPLTAEERRQIGNAVGFIFDSSDGNSIYHALQLRAMQRFRRGISMRATYTWSKSIDNSSTFGGAGNTVAQNDQNISAERGLSSFDRRHSFDMNWVLTSPVGSGTSTIPADSWQGRLLKDWTLSGTITAQTGTPLTARVLGNIADAAGTGVVGSGRADATGLPLLTGAGFFNSAAFTVPLSGEFGNAGRNTIPGPGSVTLNVGFGRAFQLDDSRRRLEFRVEADNVLNHVNYTTLNTVVNATNFGLPTAAAQMRNISAMVRFRF